MNFHYEVPMGLPNYEGQHMDVAQNSMPATLVNQNKYPFLLQTIQGHGNFSKDLPSGLISYESKNQEFLA